MTVADLLVDCLEAEGVERVYGIPGEELEDVLFALRDSDVQFVPVRHEQGAAFMANVEGRLTGEAGVCLSTLGPGATNLLTGVADAQLDKAPLVAITGQGGLERLHQESHQRLDVVDAFDPVVKWNTQLNAPAVVAESLRKAFKLAEYEKPGATHLEIPEDVAAEAADVDAHPLARRERVRRASPDQESLSRAASIVADAETPIVLAGNGAVRTDASASLRSFVESTGVPVVATYMGKGAISDRASQSLMTLDSGPDDEAAAAVEQADCVVAVGYDIAEHDPKGWNPDLEKAIVHLDHEPAEVYEHYNPDVEIVADVAESLSMLESQLDRTWSAWCSDAHETILEDVTRSPTEDDPFTVAGALPLLRDAMDDADVLVSDVGSHKMAIAQRFPVYEPRTCIISNGLASMGIGVPAGVAADACVDANVVVATGDGGFLMNAAELETAQRLGLGFTVVVFRDDDYGLISEQQRANRNESFGTGLSNPDLVEFAESFGVTGRRPETWAAFAETIERAVGSGEMTLVDVPLSA